jgi:glycyl-tRNA synthetase beta chain
MKVRRLPSRGEVRRDLLAFLHDRLKVFLRDQGIRHDVIDACLAMPGNDDLTLLVKRAEALSAFLKTEDGTNLLQGFRRANNILTQAEEKDGVEYSFGADPKFAETEPNAPSSPPSTGPRANRPRHGAEDFAAAMAAMAALRAPIDAFFDGRAGQQPTTRNPASQPPEPAAPHPGHLRPGGGPDPDRRLAPSFRTNIPRG